MSDFKLKLYLTILSSVLFSLILILLALVLPVNEPERKVFEKSPDTHFDKVSKSMRESFNK